MQTARLITGPFFWANKNPGERNGRKTLKPGLPPHWGGGQCGGWVCKVSVSQADAGEVRKPASPCNSYRQAGLDTCYWVSLRRVRTKPTIHGRSNPVILKKNLELALTRLHVLPCCCRFRCHRWLISSQDVAGRSTDLYRASQLTASCSTCGER